MGCVVSLTLGRASGHATMGRVLGQFNSAYHAPDRCVAGWLVAAERDGSFEDVATAVKSMATTLRVVGQVQRQCRERRGELDLRNRRGLRGPLP